jgi:hypothetical protein
MSSGQKKCADDEDDWDHFKTHYEIGEIGWKVYSAESELAKQLVRKTPNLKGILLKLDVSHQLAKEKLEQTQKEERKALENAITLLEKFA